MLDRILTWLGEQLPQFVKEHGWQAALIVTSVLVGLALLFIVTLRFLEVF